VQCSISLLAKAAKQAVLVEAGGGKHMNFIHNQVNQKLGYFSTYHPPTPNPVKKTFSTHGYLSIYGLGYPYVRNFVNRENNILRNFLF